MCCTVFIVYIASFFAIFFPNEMSTSSNAFTSENATLLKEYTSYNAFNSLSLTPTQTGTRLNTMASSTAKLTFRFLLVAVVALVLFYVGRPLYWKISATVHDIRHNKQTVSGG